MSFYWIIQLSSHSYNNSCNSSWGNNNNTMLTDPDLHHNCHLILHTLTSRINGSLVYINRSWMHIPKHPPVITVKELVYILDMSLQWQWQCQCSYHLETMTIMMMNLHSMLQSVHLQDWTTAITTEHLIILKAPVVQINPLPTLATSQMLVTLMGR